MQPIRNDGRLIQSEDHEQFLTSYYAMFEEFSNEARASDACYHPKACLAFLPGVTEAGQLRALAEDMAESLQTLYTNIHSGEFIPGGRRVAPRVAEPHFTPTPSMVRLDVVPTSEGLKVVEVNAGNCGGVEEYFSLYRFLRGRLFHGYQVVPSLVKRVVDLIAPGETQRLILTYIDEESRFQSIARRHIVASCKPGVSLSLSRLKDLHELVRRPSAADRIYRDFVFKELLVSEEVFRMGEPLFTDPSYPRSYPSFSDEVLADKAILSTVDQLVRNGGGKEVGFSPEQNAAWGRWMAPSLNVTRESAGSTEVDFDAPEGIVIKPAHGIAGQQVVILPTRRPPLNRSFYGGDAWVVQRFYTSPRYEVHRQGQTAAEQVSLVHGVFLLAEQGRLSYAGTFTRVSPDLVVNIKNDGEAVLYCEPEWFEA